MSIFRPAKCQNTNIKAALVGGPGSGKTFTALQLASDLQAYPILVIDTEFESAEKFFSATFKFDTINLGEGLTDKIPGIPHPKDTFHPDNLVWILREAAKAGYKAVVIDSYTAFWKGPGGQLEQVEKIALAKAKQYNRQPDTFSAWRDGGKDLDLRNLYAILDYPGHVFCTFRQETEYVRTSENGRTQIQQAGNKAAHQKDRVYELDHIFEIDKNHRIYSPKSRISEIDKKHFPSGAKLAEPFQTWIAANQPKDDGKAIKKRLVNEIAQYIELGKSLGLTIAPFTEERKGKIYNPEFPVSELQEAALNSQGLILKKIGEMVEDLPENEIKTEEAATLINRWYAAESDLTIAELERLAILVKPKAKSKKS